MLCSNYEMSDVSGCKYSDYELQNVKSQRLLPTREILSRFAKRAVANLSNVLVWRTLRLKPGMPEPFT